MFKPPSIPCRIKLDVSTVSLNGFQYPLGAALVPSSGRAGQAGKRESVEPFHTHSTEGGCDADAMIVDPAAPRLGGYAPQRHGAAREFLITLQANVVDAHFAGLNTTHYLLEVLVFDLQSITDQ